MTFWLDSRLTLKMLPADKLKVVEMNTFEKEARKSWGIRLLPAEVGLRVDVMVLLVMPANATTCLEQVDQMDQCTSIK
jgi:hypothetical protein